MSEQDSSLDPAFRPPSLEELGALLPQFEMQDFLAQGGMGAVYLARQISLDRQVAIKVLPREWGAEAGFAQRFQTEARAMAKLHHNHVVGVFDFGMTTAGHLYLVMEYVGGRTLHEMIRLKKLPVAKVQGLALQLCEGVAYAHEHGVLHRDIKPGNVLVSSSDEVKIADFGLARHAGAAVEEDALGTPDYAAPELFVEGAMVDHRADIFALGIVFQEMLTGQVPRRPREPLREHGTYDAGWEPLIAKATHDDPEKRYRTVRELREAVASIGKRVAKPAPGPGPAAARSRPPTPPRTMAPAPEPRASAFPWTILVVVLVILGVAGFWVVRNRKDFNRISTVSQGTTGVEKAPDTQVRSDGSPQPPPPVGEAPKTITNAQTDGAAPSWKDVPPGYFFKMPDPHKDVINDVAALPDHRFVASASTDGTVVVWDLQNRTRVRTFGPVQGGMLRLSISPDGRHIAAGSNDNKAYVFDMDAPEGSPPKEISTSARSVSQLAFIDGLTIILGTSDASVGLLAWEWTKGTVDVIPGYRPLVHSIQALPAAKPGAFVVLGQRPEAGGTITEFWRADAKRKSLEKELPKPPAAFHLRLTPDGRHAVAGGRGRLSYWELDTGRTIAQSDMIPGGLSSDIELIDEGRLALVGGLDRSLHVIECVSGKKVWTSPPADTQCTNSAVVLYNGRYAATGGGRRVVAGRFEKVGDYALHVWALPDPGTLKSSSAENAMVTHQVLTLETSDPELWALLSKLATEWTANSSSAEATARKELAEFYSNALRRDMNSASPSDRDLFLNELSRIANGGAGTLDPTAPPALVRLHDIYQQQVAQLPEKVAAARSNLRAAQTAQLDALEKKRKDASDTAGASRVEAVKQALSALQGEMDLAKLQQQLQQKP